MFADYDESERKLTINFEGEIDHHTCLEIAIKTDDVIRKYLPQKLIFDFKDVNFMDSSGIGMLLRQVQTTYSFWRKGTNEKYK